MQIERTRLLALGGFIGPLIFTIAVIVFAALRPGYDHIANFISELGARGTPHAMWFNIFGFLPLGLGIAGLTAALFMHLPRRPLPIVGVVLVGLFGVGVLVVSVISCEPGCPPTGSTAAVMHDTISGMAFLSVICAMGILGLAFRSIPAMRPLWTYSVLSCLLAFPFFVAIPLSMEAYTHTGLWQRIVLAIVFVWCGRVGWKVYRSL